MIKQLELPSPPILTTILIVILLTASDWALWVYTIIIPALINKYARKHQRPNYSIIAFTLSLAASIVFSNSARESIECIIYFLPALSIYLLISNSVDTTFDLNNVMQTMSYAAAIIATAGLILISANLGEEISWTEPSKLVAATQYIFISVPNDVLYLIIFIPLSTLTYLHSPSRYNQLFLIAHALSCLSLAIVLQSRLAILALLMLVILYFLIYRKGKILATLTTILFLLLCAGVYFEASIIEKFKNFEFTRIYLWRVSWEMFARFPFLGIGPHLYEQYYPLFVYKLNLNTTELHDPRTMPWAHSLYFEALAEKGILGFLTLSAILLQSTQRCKNNLKKQKSHTNIALALTIGTYIFASAVELTFHRWWSYSLFFSIVAIIETNHKLCSTTEDS